MILRPLRSLAGQEGVEKNKFEVIVVVNNPPQAPERIVEDSDLDFQKKIELYQRAIKENQEVLQLIHLIQEGTGECELSQEEVETVKFIRESGLRLFVVDKASTQRTLPPSQANVGGARNRGVAEAVERFYTQVKRDGIIVQTDADVRLDAQFVARAIKIFDAHPKVVGISGKSDFELPWGDPLYLKTTLYSDLLRKYELLLRAAYEDPSGGKMRKSISFGGANMASRAFATAFIGGVPKLDSGEDTALGERLKEVGEIMKSSELIAHPADRYSMRTKGHGFERIKMQEKLAEPGEIRVPNPIYAEYIKQLSIKLVEALKHPPVQEEVLRSIFSYEGESLIEPEELSLLMTKMTPETNLENFKTDPLMYKLVSGVVTRLKQRIGEVPLSEGLVGLKQRLLHETLTQRFETSRAAFLLEEQRNIQYKRWFVDQLAKLVFAQGPIPPTPESLTKLLVEHQEALAIPEQKMQHLTQETAGIQRTVETISGASSPEEAIQRMLEEYKMELTPPEQRTESMHMIELKALFDAMMARK